MGLDLEVVDTVVLIAASDPEHELYEKALYHLRRVLTEDEVYVASAALLEMDLELKTHGFSREERREIFEAFLSLIPSHKVLAITIEALLFAVELEYISGYFDALVGATAIVLGAKVISTDKSFTTMGISTVW